MHALTAAYMSFARLGAGASLPRHLSTGSRARRSATLAEARLVIGHAVPPGIYKQAAWRSTMRHDRWVVMSDNMKALPLRQIADNWVASIAQGRRRDSTRSIAEVMAIYDPHWRERSQLRRCKRCSTSMARFLHDARTRIARGDARAPMPIDFTLAELTRSRAASLGTPTGDKFASAVHDDLDRSGDTDEMRSMMPKTDARSMPHSSSSTRKRPPACRRLRKLADPDAADQTASAKALRRRREAQLRDPKSTYMTDQRARLAERGHVPPRIRVRRMRRRPRRRDRRRRLAPRRAVGDRCAEGGVAPRRGRCRRQDRRRRRAPHRPAASASSTMRSRRRGTRSLPNRLAVGMIFLPRTDLGAQEACRTIVESAIIEAGYTIYGWRQVPVDVSVIGRKAQATRPEIEQIMIAGPLPDEQIAEEFEKNLYLVRRRIEKRVIAAQIQGFYICSLSCRSIIYKGLFLAESRCRSSTPTCRTSGSRAASRSSTSAIRPTPSRNGGWRSRSAASRTMARSTRSAATRTGCSATRSRWRASRSASIRRTSSR